MILGLSFWYLRIFFINIGIFLLDLFCSNKGLLVLRFIKLISVEVFCLILFILYVEVV